MAARSVVKARRRFCFGPASTAPSFFAKMATEVGRNAPGGDTQRFSLEVRIKLASAEEQAKLEAYRIKSSSKLRPDLDLLGFRKLILALTGSGKIYALHNGDGHVVWSRMLPKGSAQLVPWRSDPSMETAPIIAVLGLETRSRICFS